MRKDHLDKKARRRALKVQNSREHKIAKYIKDRGLGDQCGDFEFLSDVERERFSTPQQHWEAYFKKTWGEVLIRVDSAGWPTIRS